MGPYQEACVKVRPRAFPFVSWVTEVVKPARAKDVIGNPPRGGIANLGAEQSKQDVAEHGTANLEAIQRNKDADGPGCHVQQFSAEVVTCPTPAPQAPGCIENCLHSNTHTLSQLKNYLHASTFESFGLPMLKPTCCTGQSHAGTNAGVRRLRRPFSIPLSPQQQFGTIRWSLLAPAASGNDSP